MRHVSFVSFLLRSGLSLAFLYAASAAFLDPQSWIGFLPRPMRAILPADMLLVAFSIYEIGLSLWLLSNHKTFAAALVAAATLLAITLANIYSLDIVFRDVALLFMALALAALVKPVRNPEP